MVQIALHSGRAVSLLASKTQGDSNRILQKNYFKSRSRCGNSPNFPLESKRNIDKNRSTSSVERFFESDAPTGTRTPVLALRGPRPGPLDDGGVYMPSLIRVSDGVCSSTKLPIPSGRDCIIAFSYRQLNCDFVGFRIILQRFPKKRVPTA